MDSLGERIIRDQARSRRKREWAAELEAEAKLLRAEADEIDRLLEQARRDHG